MARTALITGASGGIGEALARVMAAEGHNLVIAARSADKLLKVANDLQGTHNINVQVITKDLTEHSAPDELFAELAGTQIDILVNNAGFATYGPFVEIDLKRELDEMQLNMVALTHLTKLYLPGMIERRYGRVLNVASTASFQPGPLMAVYYATKAYVLSLSEALAEELNGTGVTVTALCPGPTATGFQSRADMTESKLVQNDLMSVETVARQGYRAMMKGQPVFIPGTRNRLQTLAIRFLPRQMVTRTVKRMQERVGH